MVAKTSPDPRLVLRFGNHADVDTVIKFIKDHWKHDHIFVRDKSLFEYMFLERDGRLNFAIACEPVSREPIAILGYLPSDSSHKRVSLSMWKSRSDANLRKYKAGIAVLRFLIDELKPKSIFSTGISSDTRDIYKFLGYSCDLMDHHVIINQEIDEFRILRGPTNAALPKQLPNLHSAKISMILLIEEFRAVAAQFNFPEPLKDIDYLCHRYFEHPSFKYEIREVSLNSKTVGILIFRRSYANDRSCIRIIDVVGPEECLTAAIKPLIEEMLANGDEYIDLLSWGLNSSALEEMGFINKLNYPECVVPEFFSPFSQTNVERWLFTNLPDSEKFFKGDGDQDRPN